MQSSTEVAIRCIHRSSRTPPGCWMSATGSRSIGRSAETHQASPQSSCTAGPAEASSPRSGACSTRHAIASCSSINAAVARAGRTPANREPI